MRMDYLSLIIRQQNMLCCILSISFYITGQTKKYTYLVNMFHDTVNLWVESLLVFSE